MCGFDLTAVSPQALDSAGQKEMAQSVYEEGVSLGIVKPWKKALVNQRSARALDLHQFSSAMTRSAIRSHLEAISFGSVKVEANLVVIVGKGLHSAKDPVIGSTVTTIIRNEFKTPVSVDPANKGRLIVLKEDLQRLGESRKWT